MIRLERLRTDHEAALLRFEQENREFFARTVPDRGDAFFSRFTTRLLLLLAEQDAGLCHFHVVLDAAGALLGRVNLVDVDGGRAELGYRVGESATGRGVATAAVFEVCRLAAGPYGLRGLTAVASLNNPASLAVLRRTGFAEVGPTVVNDLPALRFELDLASSGQ